MKIPLISVIAPAYNESAVLREFCARTAAVLKQQAQVYEIILINDGSTDDSVSVMSEIHHQDHHVKYISFSRNFGHAAAISAGIDAAEGTVVAIMDADMQDPPEVLQQFLQKWQQGYQVVYGIRTKRKESAMKRGAYWAFYRIFKRLASLKDTPLDAGDFAVIDREVVLQLRALPERSRFVRGLRAWVGFRQIGVPYERAARFAGSTKYSYAKLLKLAADGIFSFSHVPLRLATYVGFIVALIALIASVVILYLRVVMGVIGVSGFSTLIISVLFLGSIQLISVGILGEYIGRIYDEVKKRPIYIVKEAVGFEK